MSDMTDLCDRLCDLMERTLDVRFTADDIDADTSAVVRSLLIAERALEAAWQDAERALVNP